jgi:hypothetical protein
VLAQVIDTYQKRNQGPLIEQGIKALCRHHRPTATAVSWWTTTKTSKSSRQRARRRRASEHGATEHRPPRSAFSGACGWLRSKGIVDNGEPLPVIVDDITIQFDDEAAAATFKVLADLSQRTQVLFLTHHANICSMWPKRPLVLAPTSRTVCHRESSSNMNRNDFECKKALRSVQCTT